MSKIDFSFEEVGVTLPTFKDIEEIPANELVAQCKFHHTESGWKWYVIAGEKFDNGDYMLYCYVDGDFKEFGNVMLSTIIDSGAFYSLTWKSCKVFAIT